MYHHDWIMRQIQTMISMIAKLVFKKDDMEFNIYDESNSAEIHRLYERLMDLIDNLKIDEAEDLLFEKINSKDLIHMKLAMDFYNRLNKLNDEELEKGNFTREEIKLGLNDILKLYNLKLPV